MTIWDRARATVDGRIRARGQRAVLRRDSGDRECWVLEMQITANERRALKSPTARIFTITPIGLSEPPVFKEDTLILFVQPAGTTERPPFRLVAPVEPFEPGGVVVYYEIQVEQ